jgi:hypothetical protein
VTAALQAALCQSIVAAANVSYANAATPVCTVAGQTVLTAPTVTANGLVTVSGYVILQWSATPTLANLALAVVERDALAAALTTSYAAIFASTGLTVVPNCACDGLTTVVDFASSGLGYANVTPALAGPAQCDARLVYNATATVTALVGVDDGSVAPAYKGKYCSSPQLVAGGVAGVPGTGACKIYGVSTGSGDTAQATATDLKVASCSVGTGGAYTGDLPTLTFTAPTSTAVTRVLAAGAVTVSASSFAMGTPTIIPAQVLYPAVAGTVYFSGTGNGVYDTTTGIPTASFPVPPAPGTTASATPVMGLLAVSLTGGVGYTAGSTLRITGPGGCAASVVINQVTTAGPTAATGIPVTVSIFARRSISAESGTGCTGFTGYTITACNNTIQGDPCTNTVATTVAAVQLTVMGMSNIVPGSGYTVTPTPTFTASTITALLSNTATVTVAGVAVTSSTTIAAGSTVGVANSGVATFALTNAVTYPVGTFLSFIGAAGGNANTALLDIVTRVTASSANSVTVGVPLAFTNTATDRIITVSPSTP